MTAVTAETIIPYRWLIIVAVMSATLMQVLDTTIVNVALPHIQGSLGASSDEISWTLTSYLVASAIFMPLTGYFTDKLGQKNYLLICMAGFTVASALCGLSLNITEMVVFRLLQGIFGAALVPLSQTIMTNIYSDQERGKAMAIWGLGVMVGPILGPTLGGVLTEYANWRWTFYVNVPIGIMAFIISWYVVPDSAKKTRAMDWIGLTAISFAIGGFQYFLDRGNQQDWFNASDICVAAALSLGGLFGFIVHNARRPSKIVFDLRIFKDRNFTLCSFLIAVMGLGMYGAMIIQPIMLEGIFNYPVLLTGLVMAPRGIAGMVSMFIVSKLIGKVDARQLIVTGILLSVAGIAICTYYALEISPGWIIGPLLLQGFGLSLVFAPLSTVAYATLPLSSRAEAAGLFSLLRTMGSSIGISLVVTVYTRHTQVAWNHLGGFIQPYNQALYHYLAPLNLSPEQPQAATILALELSRQAQMVGFLDAYKFIMWGFLLMLPLVFLMKKSTVISKNAALDADH